MPTFTDDELETKKPIAAKNDDLDVDWGDEDAMSTSDGLDKIMPADKSSVVRVAVLTDVVKPKMAWLHFISKGEKKGSYRCKSDRDKKGNIIGEPGECCKKLNSDDEQKAQLVFAVLGLKYTNADQKDGKYKKDASGEVAPVRYELGWVKLSRSGFKAISKLVMEGEEAHEFDFGISYRENKIGFDYNRVSQKARYRMNPELLAEVRKAAQPFADGQLLAKKLGKNIPAIEMKALLSGAVAASKAAADIDNTDDL